MARVSVFCFSMISSGGGIHLEFHCIDAEAEVVFAEVVRVALEAWVLEMGRMLLAVGTRGG